MKLGKKSSKKSGISILLFVAAIFVALVGIALLVTNIIYFKNTIDNYVAQGYTYATVAKELIPSQLLPGIFQPVALYLGLAIALLGLSAVNQKASVCCSSKTDEDALDTDECSCCDSEEETEDITEDVSDETAEEVAVEGTEELYDSTKVEENVKPVE